MAWVRTTVAMITFGFTVYKFFQYMEETRGAQPDRLLTPRGFGLLMIAAGMAMLVLATVQHALSLKRLGREYPAMPRSLASVFAALISAIGILALFAAIFRG